MTMEGGWEPSIAQPTGQTPLREFEAVLKEISHRDGSGQDESTGRSWTYRNIVFDFTDLEVIKSIEVYPFPVAQISIRYADPSSSRGGTAWAAFSESCRQVLGPGGQLTALVGKRQRWAFLPATLRMRDQDGNWGDSQGEAWKVVSVEGVGESGAVGGKTDTMSTVLDILNGKTEKVFNAEALADATIRADPDVVSSIVNRKLLPQLKEEGKAVEDAEGVWHVTAAETSAEGG